MNQPILIATAGHVDHGKSTLVHTLTGTDPDRWAAEKERGITIDLGYAHLLRNGRAYSFIDVPGHERFVHNMLAGVGSIDGVLFVIAADESIMPQTREHALALRWLGVKQVHVVLTKVDLVDADLLELLDEEVGDWLAENGWSDAQRVHFSSKQPETTASVLALLDQMEKRDEAVGGHFRLSVDRVFTSPGSGTVLTGTVDRGVLALKSQVTLLPHGAEAHVRGLQMHGDDVTEVGAHTRAAVNLGGIHFQDINRGDALYQEAPPNPATKMLVRFHHFDEDWQPGPKHYFHVHHLAAGLYGRLLWREGDIGALELRKPHGFWALDRGLIRDGSPLMIRAGFEVLDPNLYRAKKRQALEGMGDLPAEGDLDGWQRWYLTRQRGPIDLLDLQSRCGENLSPALKAHLVYLDDHTAVTPGRLAAYRQQFRAIMQEAHDALPLYQNLPLNEITSRLRDQRWEDKLMDLVFARAQEDGEIVKSADRIRQVGHQPTWSPQDKANLKTFLAQLDDGIAVIDLRLLKDSRKQTIAVEKMLIWEGYLINITSDLLIHYDFLNRIAAKLTDAFGDQLFSIPQLKDLFGFSRKYAVPLLEYLDKKGYTRREEDSRRWIARTAPVWQCTSKLPLNI